MILRGKTTTRFLFFILFRLREFYFDYEQLHGNKNRIRAMENGYWRASKISRIYIDPW